VASSVWIRVLEWFSILAVVAAVGFIVYLGRIRH
jgi:hypothetical protein